MGLIGKALKYVEAAATQKLEDTDTSFAELAARARAELDDISRDPQDHMNQLRDALGITRDTFATAATSSSKEEAIGALKDLPKAFVPPKKFVFDPDNPPLTSEMYERLQDERVESGIPISEEEIDRLTERVNAMRDFTRLDPSEAELYLDDPANYIQAVRDRLEAELPTTQDESAEESSDEEEQDEEA